jgi:NADH:ubiquinone oxidoreductase subunit D
MDYASLDNSGATPGQARGSSKLVGTLNGKRVYSVRYPAGYLALLVERQADRYLPVLMVSTRIPFDRLGILTMEGEEVLAYNATLPGTGHLTTEWYFTLDRGVPQRVDYMPVLTAELKRILPEHLGLWKGGGFDPDTLVFSHQVWRNGDANCCPNGGSVQVVLGFRNGQFFIKSSRFEASK